MRRIRTILACLLAAGVPACGDDNGSGPEGSTNLSLLLTDAPGDVRAAVVTISEIYLQGGPDGQTTLLDEPVTVDLTEYSNATVELLGDIEVKQGSYGELRFVVSGAYVEVESETGSEIFASSPDYSGLPAGASVDGELDLSSLGTAGLKVNFDESLTFTESEQTLLVDFDVAQSFEAEAGSSERWVMHPVVTGTDVTAAATVTVTLGLGAGVSLPAGVVGTAFKARLDGEELAFTDANADGTFEAVFQFVMPGPHTVSIEAPSGITITTNPALPASVTVAEGAEATQAITLTAITVIP